MKVLRQQFWEAVSLMSDAGVSHSEMAPLFLLLVTFSNVRINEHVVKFCAYVLYI